MTRAAWLSARTRSDKPRCEVEWQNGGAERSGVFPGDVGRDFGGVSVGFGDRAEFVGGNGLRFLAGEEPGFGGGAGFGEQGQWLGAAFDRAR
ncbi:MAG: hypothetical protein ACKV2Q_13605, partial [Planctomycetaceae bacterium]